MGRDLATQTRVLAKRGLVAHQTCPVEGLIIGVKASRIGPSKFMFEYVVIGETDRILLPSQAMPERVDGLWNHTCFEAFFRFEDGSYLEFNFAPSRQWAAYRFDSYRNGMTLADEDCAPEVFLVSFGPPRLALNAYVRLAQQDSGRVSAIALSAVIEETDGTKSYWALAHPPGKPDFHAPACFALTLPPPEQP